MEEEIKDKENRRTVGRGGEFRGGEWKKGKERGDGVGELNKNERISSLASANLISVPTNQQTLLLAHTSSPL